MNLERIDIFKTPAPTFTIKNYLNGVPSVPGAIASVFLVVVLSLYSIYQSLDLGEFVSIDDRYEEPTTVTSENPID
jgi:hypothetical protein